MTRITGQILMPDNTVPPNARVEWLLVAPGREDGRIVAPGPDIFSLDSTGQMDGLLWASALNEQDGVVLPLAYRVTLTWWNPEHGRRETAALGSAVIWASPQPLTPMQVINGGQYVPLQGDALATMLAYLAQATVQANLAQSFATQATDASIIAMASAANAQAIGFAAREFAGLFSGNLDTLTCIGLPAKERVYTLATGFTNGPPLVGPPDLVEVIPTAAYKNLAMGSADVGNSTPWPTPVVQNGLTATKVATGVDGDGLPYADYRLQGTATGVHDGIYNVMQSQQATAEGAQFAAGFIARRIAGSLSAGRGLRVALNQRTGGSSTGTNLGPIIAGSSDELSSVSMTIGSGRDAVRTFIRFQCDAGDVIDVTFRIKALQMEAGLNRTGYEPVRTVTDVFPGSPIRSVMQRVVAAPVIIGDLVIPQRGAARQLSAGGWLPWVYAAEMFWRYLSAPQAITSASLLTLLHGLPRAPSEVKLVARCITAQSPYAVGDEVDIVAGAAVSWNQTAIMVRTGASVTALNNSGGSLTLNAANWQYIVRAR
ncbi:hypothetical protein [Paragemmobacter ruber]|uniref:Minor tail protein n=1 Tax=Paragemmobacter ruber TaxID=1985673 RepID=A0ABW9Y0K3_9RHOB|nr:hypothetical protein [Rhodobacter ruber]NBE05922.1 hypothetical protein [Rhodobacter ruber]